MKRRLGTLQGSWGTPVRLFAHALECANRNHIKDHTLSTPVRLFALAVPSASRSHIEGAAYFYADELQVTKAPTVHTCALVCPLACQVSTGATWKALLLVLVQMVCKAWRKAHPEHTCALALAMPSPDGHHIKGVSYTIQ
eukprot:scaffold15178_cov20-Tisochrysis_lutea.AAC.4